MVSSANGYNPLRWDCEKRGCYNIKHRPKIEVFSDCFPGRISFGDVDGIVEINGKALMLEWKSYNGELPAGQRIMYERITRKSPIIVLCVVGDAESMDCKGYSFFYRGKQQEYVTADLQSIMDWISKWAKWAKRD